MSNSINSKRVEDFNVDDCLALRLRLRSHVFVLIVIYRSPSLSIGDNFHLIESLNSFCKSIPSDQSIIVTGDFNLPDVNWTDGIIRAPKDSTNVHLNMQASFLSTLQMNNLQWCVGDSQYTRIKSVSDQTQRSTLDQIFLSDMNLLRNLRVLPPLGKSDHVGLLTSLNAQTDKRLVKSSLRLWGKVKTDTLVSHGNAIKWAVRTGDVENIWHEIHQNLINITATVPSKNLTGSLPYSYSTAVRRAYKLSAKAWSAAFKSPTSLNYSIAMGPP